MGGRRAQRNDPEWLDLEKRTAATYRSMGYTVERDVLVGGSQIDLVARRTSAGAPDIVLAIEVKLRTERSIPLKVVTAFKVVATALLNDRHVTGAVLVGNVGVTRNGRVALEEDRRLRSYDIASLERALYYDESVLRAFREEFMRGRLSSRLVDIVVTPDEPGPDVHPTTTSRLLTVAEEHAGAAAISITADYGAGKTTALRQAKALALDRFLRGRSTRLPLLFNLAELLAFDSLTTFVGATMRRELGTETALRTFDTDRAGGLYLLLLDGFDEIAVQPNEREKELYLERIGPLLFAGSPCIISSRPSYFPELKAYKRALLARAEAGGLLGPRNPRRNLLSPAGAQLVRDLRTHVSDGHQGSSCLFYTLQPLNEGQIAQYLEKHADVFTEKGIASWRDVRDFIDRIYDLGDLAQRPMLLELIVETITKGAVDIYDTDRGVGPAELYEAYVLLRLSYDIDKLQSDRSTGLDPLQRRAYAEAAAWEMNANGTLELDADAAEALLVETFPAMVDGTPDTVERLMTDLRTCSFLTTGGTGTLEFMHKSFVDYFVACRLRDSLAGRDRGREVVRTAQFSNAVLYFLGSMARADTTTPGIHTRSILRGLLVEEMRHSDPEVSDIYRHILVTALLHAPTGCDGLTLAGVTAGPVRSPRTTVRGVRGKDLALEIHGERIDVVGSVLMASVISGSARTIRFDRSGLDVSLTGPVDTVLVEGSTGSLRVTQPHDVRVSESELTLFVDGSSSVRARTSKLTMVTNGGRSTLDLRDTLAFFGTTDHRRGPPEGEVHVCADHSVIVVPNARRQVLTGTVYGSILVVDPDVPLHALLRLRLVDCIILGSHVLVDDEAGWDTDASEWLEFAGGMVMYRDPHLPQEVARPTNLGGGVHLVGQATDLAAVFHQSQGLRSVAVGSRKWTILVDRLADAISELPSVASADRASERLTNILRSLPPTPTRR